MTTKRKPISKAARAHCVECCGGATRGEDSPSGCNSPACGLYELRINGKADGVSQCKAIRRRCLDCAGSVGAVRDCTETACDLHPYRMGKNPRRSKTCPDSLPKPPLSDVLGAPDRREHEAGVTGTLRSRDDSGAVPDAAEGGDE